MGMTQEELDDISASFSEAWRDYFGMDVYFLVYQETDSESELYSSNPNPLESEEIGPIKARFSSNVTELLAKEYGLSEEVETAFSFVTADLTSKSVSPKKGDIIKAIFRDGKEVQYIITEIGLSTQFLDNFIFTNIGVVNKQ